MNRILLILAVLVYASSATAENNGIFTAGATITPTPTPEPTITSTPCPTDAAPTGDANIEPDALTVHVGETFHFNVSISCPPNPCGRCDTAGVGGFFDTDHVVSVDPNVGPGSIWHSPPDFRAVKAGDTEIVAQPIGFSFSSGGADSIAITILPLPTPAPDSLDADRDGVSDSYEAIAGTDPQIPDSDGDGLYDGVEMGLGLDPRVANDFSAMADSDGDGIPDDFDPGPDTNDADGDRFTDAWELAVASDPLDANSRPELGDVWVDGAIDNVDAVMVVSHHLGVGTPLARPHVADVNLDGQTDNVDAVILFNWYLGNIETLPMQ